MAINTSTNKFRVITTTVSGLTSNSKFSDIKTSALVINTSEGGLFYTDGSKSTLTQLAALPNHTHSEYATTAQLGNYLSKSGGTITTDSIAGFSIYRNNNVYSTIHFYNTQDDTMTDVGYLGAVADGRPVYINSGGSVYDLIHSNNISTQSVANASNVYINNSPNNGAFPITFVSNTTKGNQALFVSTGKSLTFNPSTGALTATKFVGDVSGNAVTATSATSVVVGTGSSSAYRPIVVHSGNALYSAGTAEGKPQYCYSTGDVKAKSFTTDGGTFVGNLTGNALTATNATSATLSATTNKLNCPDSRNISILPNETTVGIIADFKAKAITGLTSTYSGVITFRSYGNESDLSGGPVYQIAMDSVGIHSRTSKDASTWNTWLNILDSSNYTDYCASVGHSHGGYLTSQTWRPIKINNSQKLANSSSTALDISAGSNISLTWDSTNNRVTIAATDTKYTHPASTSGTTAVDTSAITAATPAHGGSFTVVTGALRDASGHISKVTTQQITLPGDNNTDTKVTTSASSSKLFIIGKTDASKATASAANYNASAYIDASGYLYSGGTKVLTSYTDTKNTAGADNTTSKIFLVGPTAQTSSNGTARTYSNSSCYASGGYLYSGGTKVSVEGHSHSNYLTTSGGTTTGDLTLYNNGGNGITPKLNFIRGTSEDTYYDWEVYDEGGYLKFATDVGSSTKIIATLYETGMEITGNVTATKFIGDVSGNATTATTATTASKVTVGTGSGDAYRAIVVHNEGGLFSAGTAEGKPQYNYSTGDVKATSFSGNINGGTISGTTGTFSGAITLTGTSGSAVAKIAFSRETYNYISSPTGSNIGIHPGGISLSSTTGYKFDATSFFPGVTNTYTIGTSSLKWKNIYATTFTGSLSGNATSATSATSLSSFDAASSTSTKRYVWFSYDDNSAKPAYTDKLTFQTSTNTLFVNDKAVSVEGHTHSEYSTTDTKNTAGSSNKKTKIFVVGATSQSSTGVTTYSDVSVYITDGKLYASNFITSSDERIKTNIKDVKNSVDSLGLRFVEFDYKDSSNHSAGHIAQEVKEVLPEFVHGNESETEHLSIDYTALHSIQIKALLDRIEKLEDEIKQLKSSNIRFK